MKWAGGGEGRGGAIRRGQEEASAVVGENVGEVMGARGRQSTGVGRVNLMAQCATGSGQQEHLSLRYPRVAQVSAGVRRLAEKRGCGSRCGWPKAPDRRLS